MKRLDLTAFVMRQVLPAARGIVQRNEKIVLSARDTASDEVSKKILQDKLDTLEATNPFILINAVEAGLGMYDGIKQVRTVSLHRRIYKIGFLLILLGVIFQVTANAIAWAGVYGIFA